MTYNLFLLLGDGYMARFCLSLLRISQKNAVAPLVSVVVVVSACMQRCF